MELTAILSDAAVAAPAGTARFGLQLTRALVVTAPDGSVVDGYTHRIPPSARASLVQQLPGLRGLRGSLLPRPLLARAWESARASIPRGDAVLAPSLFAPLASGRAGSGAPLVVTVHDLVPFTHPETLSARGVRWHREQILRAQRRADAILVPSQAVALALERFAPAPGRVHVVPGAASPSLIAADPAEAIPTDTAPYVLFIGTLEPRKGLDLLVAAAALPALRGARLVIAGADGWGGVDIARYAREAGLDPARLRVTGRIDDAQLATLIRGASVLAAPSRAEGFGLPLVEAMALGTPVVHSLDPALVETAGGAGIGVDLSGDPADAAVRLAASLERVLAEPGLAARLGELGVTRAADFSWAESAEKVWRLLGV